MKSDKEERLNLSRTESRLIEDYIYRSNDEIQELKKSISEMRIDRQFRSFPRWFAKGIKRFLLNRVSNSTKNRIKIFLKWWSDLQSRNPKIFSSASNKTNYAKAQKSLLILAHNYPTKEGDYGGLPIARRIPFYLESGYKVSVLIPSTKRNQRHLTTEEGVEIFFTPLKELERTAKKVGASQLAIHSPTPELSLGAKKLMLDLPTHIWIHGFEARSWRELKFDFSNEEIAKDGKKLDITDVERQWALSELFKNPEITKIFVSEFMLSKAEEFVGTPVTSPNVIHNVIDPQLFPYRPKSEDMRNRICSVRNFEKRNYGTDLMSKAILELTTMPWFSNLRFEIYGDGRHYDQDTRPFRSLPNIKLNRSFIGSETLSKVFERNGIALLPTRWDSQGMLNGEAMCSGLVPVSNNVTAIPEFISPKQGVLGDSENYEQLAQGIAELVENPDKFLEMSELSSRRAFSQCHPDVTVQKEIDIFDSYSS